MLIYHVFIWICVEQRSSKVSISKKKYCCLIATVVLMTAIVSIGISVPVALYLSNQTNDRDNDFMECENDLTNGRFSIGNVQYQTVFEKGNADTRPILQGNQEHWERTCQKNNMTLINIGDVYSITRRVKQKKVWYKIMSSGSIWLENSPFDESIFSKG